MHANLKRLLENYIFASAVSMNHGLGSWTTSSWTMGFRAGGIANTLDVHEIHRLSVFLQSSKPVTDHIIYVHLYAFFKFPDVHSACTKPLHASPDVHIYAFDFSFACSNSKSAYLFDPGVGIEQPPRPIPRKDTMAKK